MQINNDLTITVMGIKFTIFLILACIGGLGMLVEYIELNLSLKNTNPKGSYGEYIKGEIKTFWKIPGYYVVLFVILHLVYLAIMK